MIAPFVWNYSGTLQEVMVRTLLFYLLLLTCGRENQRNRFCDDNLVEER